jgi:anti-anti-sigma regulatory factor
MPGAGYMLRLSKIAQTPLSVALKVEGRIVEEWGSLLVAKILRYSRERERVVLDFSGVTFIDDPAAASLRALPRQSIEIVNCSAFIDALLKGEGHEPGNEPN